MAAWNKRAQRMLAALAAQAAESGRRGGLGDVDPTFGARGEMAAGMSQNREDPQGFLKPNALANAGVAERYGEGGMDRRTARAEFYETDPRFEGVDDIGDTNERQRKILARRGLLGEGGGPISAKRDLLPEMLKAARRRQLGGFDAGPKPMGAGGTDGGKQVAPLAPAGTIPGVAGGGNLSTSDFGGVANTSTNPIAGLMFQGLRGMGERQPRRRRGGRNYSFARNLRG